MLGYESPLVDGVSEAANTAFGGYYSSVPDMTKTPPLSHCKMIQTREKSSFEIGATLQDFQGDGGINKRCEKLSEAELDLRVPQAVSSASLVQVNPHQSKSRLRDVDPVEKGSELQSPHRSLHALS